VLHIFILSLFPRMFEGPFRESIVSRAVEKGLVSIDIRNTRDYATDKHRTVDDYPYSGGPGMVMKPGPLFDAVESVMGSIRGAEPEAEGKPRVILVTPQGRLFTQDMARELATERNLVFVCGHYEGVDERVRQHLVTDEISIGDFVLTGGELPAMVIVDAVVRLLPGALGDQASAEDDSHSHGLLQHPLYTRPPSYKGMDVPEILLSGDHQKVAKWQRKQSLLRTLERRPDLIEKAELTPKEREWIEAIREGRLAP